VSVAEVVVPAETQSGSLARDLMVALARAGVTATCSGADRPRYGYLGVDSNLPDARIVVGGSSQNAFTKTVLAGADPVYAAEVDRQLAEAGRAAVWVPATASLAEGWVPGADLRDPAALPVLVIASRDDAELGVAVASLVADLADTEVGLDQQAPTGMQRGESRTVALLNRGTPSFAVDSDGTLNTALMRSCTGWPSRSWIDEPRRTAPDGSSFQLQHWTHSFNYALVAGDGDWREAAIPARSADFSDPLLAVLRSAGPGALPTDGSLLDVAPAGGVQLAALKPAGNPLVRNSAQVVDPSAVALRLVETQGRSVDAEVRTALGTLSDLQAADLLETPLPERPGKPTAALGGYQISTELARLQIPRLIDSAVTALAPEAENCQPLYARYWLHNRGPAPLGGLPIVAHLHPHRVAASGEDLALRLTVASDCVDAELKGDVTLVCPPGWSAESVPFGLPPGEHLESQLTVRIPQHVEPGVYPVRAQLLLSGKDIPPSWRQVVEDVCMVTVGDVDESTVLYLVEGPADLEVAVGDSARLSVTVGSEAGADLNLEAHLISPWGTWDWMGPATRGAVLPARGTVDLSFDVTPPPWVEPGRWWALVRVGCAGNLVYSHAVNVAVR